MDFTTVVSQMPPLQIPIDASRCVQMSPHDTGCFHTPPSPGCSRCLQMTPRCFRMPPDGLQMFPDALMPAGFLLGESWVSPDIPDVSKCFQMEPDASRARCFSDASLLLSRGLRMPPRPNVSQSRPVACRCFEQCLSVTPSRACSHSYLRHSGRSNPIF